MENNQFINIKNINMPYGIPKINFYKNPGYYEIAVPLFERCNLNCGFCFEKHLDNKIDYDKILAMPRKIIEQVSNDIKLYKTKRILLRLWGGELFFDALPDELFNIYKKFATQFKSLAKKFFPWANVEITWLSNGVFTKRKRVEKLMNDIGGTLDFSYDPVGRFINEEQKKIWYDTLMYFRNKTTHVSITLTAPSIKAYIAGDKYFDMIPNDIGIDVNYYTANPGWEKYLPTDDDIFNFFQWAIDNHRYDIYIVENAIRHMIPNDAPFVEKYCDCKFAVQYINGKCIKDCALRASTLNRNKFYGKYTNNTDEGNVTEVKNSLGLLKRGCLQCQHFSTCSMMCWISTIFTEYKATSCPLKRIYEYIDNKDIEDFKKWEEYRK